MPSNVLIDPPQLINEMHATAEKELRAFARAVNELFGAAQAKQAAQDWIEEFEAIDCPGGEAILRWRQVTMLAAARLADRVSILRSEKTETADRP